MMSQLAKCPKRYDPGEVKRSKTVKPRVHKYADDAAQFNWPGVSKTMNVGPFTRWVYTGFSIASADPKASPSEAKRLFKEIKNRQDEGLFVGEEGTVGNELYHGAKRAAVMFGYTDCQNIKKENVDLQWERAKNIEQLADDAGLTVLAAEDIDAMRDNVDPKGTEQAVIDAYDRTSRDRPSELYLGQNKESQATGSTISDGELWRRANRSVLIAEIPVPLMSSDKKQLDQVAAEAAAERVTRARDRIGSGWIADYKLSTSDKLDGWGKCFLKKVETKVADLVTSLDGTGGFLSRSHGKTYPEADYIFGFKLSQCNMGSTEECRYWTPCQGISAGKNSFCSAFNSNSDPNTTDVGQRNLVVDVAAALMNKDMTKTKFYSYIDDFVNIDGGIYNGVYNYMAERAAGMLSNNSDGPHMKKWIHWFQRQRQKTDSVYSCFNADYLFASSYDEFQSGVGDRMNPKAPW